MARYQRVFPLVDSVENSFSKIHTFLTGKKFRYEVSDGQQVFRKGDGFWTAARFIRVSYEGNFALLEAWVDAMGSEMDLEGFVGCAAKKPLKKVVNQVEAILTQPGYGYVPAENPAPFPAFTEQKQVLPAGITKKEYIKHYAGENFRRNLRNTAIVGYIAAGLNMGVAVLNFVGMLVGAATPFLFLLTLLEAAVILGLTLGMHLGRSKGCAIGMLVYGIYAVVSNLIFNGSFGGWLLLLLGIMAIRVFNNAEKSYQEQSAAPAQPYNGTYGN